MLPGIPVQVDEAKVVGFELADGPIGVSRVGAIVAGREAFLKITEGLNVTQGNEPTISG